MGDGSVPVAESVVVTVPGEGALKLLPVWVTEARYVDSGGSLKLEWKNYIGVSARMRWVACLEAKTAQEVVTEFAEWARVHGHAPALDHPLWRDLWAAAE